MNDFVDFWNWISLKKSFYLFIKLRYFGDTREDFNGAKKSDFNDYTLAFIQVENHKIDV